MFGCSLDVAGKRRPWTYRNKSPVTKVIDCAEEPEFVEEQIGSCHSALVWKRQETKENVTSFLKAFAISVPKPFGPLDGGTSYFLFQVAVAVEKNSQGQRKL